MPSAERPPFIVSPADVPEERGSYEGLDESMGFFRAIGKAAGLERIGLHLQRLPPGERTSLPHAEEAEEEFVFVVSGTLDLWIDGVLHPMRAGDLAAFPAGTGIAHCGINNSATETLLLVGGERSKPTNRFVYPLDPGRRATMKPGQWWEDAPKRDLGPHDGRPHE